MDDWFIRMPYCPLVHSMHTQETVLQNLHDCWDANEYQRDGTYCFVSLGCVQLIVEDETD
jgi:hypothetical protein